MTPAAPVVTVDVVIDNYNYGRFLADAIDSALAQTYPHVRVIVVDDGSTDDSREVIARYEGRVTALHKENGGQASAFNAGIAAGSGDVVLLLDSDDLLEPRAAARVVHAFAQHPGTVMAHFQMTIVDDANRPTGRRNPPPHIAIPHGDLRRAVTSFPFDLSLGQGGANAYLGRVLRSILPMDEEAYRRLADYYVVHVMALHGPVAAIEEPLGRYRLHGGNEYERAEGRLDLGHIRSSIAFAAITSRDIRRHAARLGIAEDAPGLSMSDIGNRMISLRLDPRSHPVPSDTRAGLIRLGIAAARARFDARPPFRIAFVAWLLLLAVAPRALARTLAELFVFPTRRAALNGALRRLHRAT